MADRGLTDGTYDAEGQPYPRYAEGGPHCNCPTCGQKMPTAKVTVEMLRDIRYGPTERRIMEVLIGSYPRRRATHAIALDAWDDHPAEEPASSPDIVRRMVMELRKRIAPFGWTIHNTRGRGSEGYVLQPIKK